MAGSFDHLITKQYRGEPVVSIIDSPVTALFGVSDDDAERLRDAFGIETVGDLAANRFVLRAQAILEAAVGLEHDRGPNEDWTKFFKGAPLAVYHANPDDFRLDFGPVWYRGRLDGTARVLIVGQDPAANELVGHRIFVGTSGQRVQGYLAKLGIRRDYLLINTFLYSVFGQFFQLADLSHDPQIEGFRNALLDRIAKLNPLEAIIAVGSAGKDAIERWPNMGNIPVQHIQHPSARDHAVLLASWNTGLDRLHSVIDPEQGVTPNMTPYGDDFVGADHVPIPRRDLPFGVPEWHGVGTHASRGKKSDGSTDHKLIHWRAP